MTKYLIALSFCFSFFFASSQTRIRYTTDIYFGQKSYQIPLYSSNNVEKKIKSKSTYNHELKKGEVVNKHQSRQVDYNDRGQTLSELMFNSKGKLAFQYAAEYNTEGALLKNIFRNKKDQFIQVYSYTYNTDGKVIKDESFEGKNLKLRNTTETSWNDQSKRSEERHFKTSKNRLSGYRQFEYFEGGQIKAVHSFNNKSERTGTVSYTCNPKGQTLKKIEKEVCNKVEEDLNGNIVKTYESSDYKMRTTREVRILDKNNHILQIETYDYKGERTKKQTFTYNDKWQVVSSETINRKNRKEKIEVEYNDVGLADKIIVYQAGEAKPIQIQSYTYEYF